jgi:hypothetical protein
MSTMVVTVKSAFLPETHGVQAVSVPSLARGSLRSAPGGVARGEDSSTALGLKHSHDRPIFRD